MIIQTTNEKRRPSKRREKKMREIVQTCLLTQTLFRYKHVIYEPYSWLWPYVCWLDCKQKKERNELCHKLFINSFCAKEQMHQCERTWHKRKKKLLRKMFQNCTFWVESLWHEKKNQVVREEERFLSERVTSIAEDSMN